MSLGVRKLDINCEDAYNRVDVNFEVGDKKKSTPRLDIKKIGINSEAGMENDIQQL